MSTPFENIIDKALVVMRDYSLESVYDMNEDVFAQIMQNYLLKGVPRFTECLQDLSYDVTTVFLTLIYLILKWIF